MDPLAGSPWSTPDTVDGFAKALPNDVLLNAAANALGLADDRRLLDIGCGVGRNAAPLARMGWAHEDALLVGTCFSRAAAGMA